MNKRLYYCYWSGAWYCVIATSAEEAFKILTDSGRPQSFISHSEEYNGNLENGFMFSECFYDLYVGL